MCASAKTQIKILYICLILFHNLFTDNTKLICLTTQLIIKQTAMKTLKSSKHLGQSVAMGVLLLLASAGVITVMTLHTASLP